MPDENIGNLGKTEAKIYKEEEYDTMIEMIKAGMWRNVNLVNALHVDEQTILKWKKRPEVIEAHKQTFIKFLKKREDVEKILKEIGMETEPDIDTLIQNNYLSLTDEQLNQIIQSKSRQIGTHSVTDGEAEEDSGEPA